MRFDQDDYTVETKTVSTEDGERQVTYRLYKEIVYVANPVDEKYQSLNVQVPVEIDRAAVDATGAPILLDSSIGGYLSATPGGSAGVPPGGGQMVGNADLALAAGYFVVLSGARGRDLSTLLGESGDSHLYDACLRDLGAADASDAIFATAAYCPIDLEHADMANGWSSGAVPLNSSGQLVDQTVSTELSTAFADYQASPRLRGHGFGAITAGDYRRHH